MNSYKIIITQRAYSDINECVSFVKNVSIEAANNLYREIISSIQSLSTFPNMYPEIQDLTISSFKVRKMPLYQGRYLILYKVTGDTVVIYDVIDVRKDNIVSILFSEK